MEASPQTEHRDPASMAGSFVCQQGRSSNASSSSSGAAVLVEIVRAVRLFSKDHVPLALVAASPTCRLLLESHNAPFLNRLNLTHVVAFHTVNQCCGLGLRDRISTVRVTASQVEAIRSLKERGSNTAAAPYHEGASSPYYGKDGQWLDICIEPSHDFSSRSCDRGAGLLRVGMPSSIACEQKCSCELVDPSSPISSNSNSDNPLFCYGDDTDPRVRDPAVHTYPYTNTRSVFSVEGITTFGNSDEADHDGALCRYWDYATADMSSEQHQLPAMVLVFLWLEPSASSVSETLLGNMLWWLRRPPVFRRQDSTMPAPLQPAPVFMHVYRSASASFLQRVVSSELPLVGLTVVKSPWICTSPTFMKEDPYSVREGQDGFCDVGTHLSRCGVSTNDDDSFRRLRYLCISSSPLTTKGLDALLARVPLLLELVVYVNTTKQFSDVPPLAVRCPDMVRLMLHTCNHLVSLNGVAHCAQLRDVLISTCVKLTDMEVLATCPMLRRLRVNACAQINPDPWMASLLPDDENTNEAPAVHESFINASNAKEAPSSLLTLLELSELDPQSFQLGALRHFSQLHTLDLHMTPVDDDALEIVADACTVLRALSLAECFLVTSIAPLGKLTRLTYLMLRNTSVTNFGLAEYSAVQPPPLIRALDISGCDELTDIAVLAQLPELERLDAQETHVTEDSVIQLVKRLAHLHGTGKGFSLSLIDLRGCHEVRNTDAILASVRGINCYTPFVK